MNATSSSERYAAARRALAANDAVDRGDDHRERTARDGLAAALRALIESAPTAKPESPGAIAVTIQRNWNLMRPASMPGHQLTEMLTEAVKAGIQSAWESWEPEAAMPADGIEQILTAEAASLPPQSVCQNTFALAEREPQFAPPGEPDRYRDLREENMPRVSGRMYFAIPGEQPLHVSDELAHHILASISEENR